MARQLDFETHRQTLTRSKGVRRTVEHIGSGTKLVARGSVPFLVRWAPVWLPAVLLTQIALFGLMPVLAERSRLDRVESEVSAREDALRAAHASAQKHRRMLGDDIYRERVKKSLARSQEPPLFRAEIVEPGRN